MVENKFVKFLSAYGPIATSNNMYDEFVVESSKKAGIEPIKIEENNSKEIFEILFKINNSKSVILTGTAGDGKTYTARLVLEMINQKFNTNAAWTNTQSEFSVELEKKTVTFLKDMSELSEERKNQLIPKITRSFQTQNTDDLYVICVNDGHLLKSWRDYPNKEDHLIQEVFDELQILLRDDCQKTDKFSFELFNLSRRSNANILDHIINTFCQHSAWSQCLGCPVFERGCPIIQNKKQLEINQSNSIRERLKDLIAIAATNDEHMSIRQLMILIVNILLGDHRDYSKPLLDCKRAIRYTNYNQDGIYGNIFGENLPIKQRFQYSIFSTLYKFAIGFETNKFFEQKIFADIPCDEDTYFEEIEDLKIDQRQIELQYQNMMILKRRKMFFSFAPENQVEDQCVWNLTTYKYADIYLKLIDIKKDILDNDYKQFIEKILKKLVKGLNRILTQSLTNTDQALWLTEAFYSNNNVNYLNLRFGPEIPIKRKKAFSFSISLATAVSGRAPCLKLIYQEKDISKLNLSLPIFEYILQVSDGLLLDGVSHHKLQEIKNFQIRCLGAITIIYSDDDEDDDVHNVINIDENGYLIETKIREMEK